MGRERPDPNSHIARYVGAGGKLVFPRRGGRSRTKLPESGKFSVFHAVYSKGSGGSTFHLWPEVDSSRRVIVPCEWAHPIRTKRTILRAAEELASQEPRLPTPVRVWWG